MRFKDFRQYLDERSRNTPAVKAWLNTRAKPYEYWMSPQFTLPFPLSKGMMQRMQNVTENALAFHITDTDGIDTLFSLQNSAKSLSVTTNVKDEYDGMTMLEGVETAGGVLVEVRGDIIFEGEFDIFSSPDSQGRRWIDINQFARRLANDNKAYLLQDWDLIYRKTIMDHAMDFYKSNRKELEEVYEKFYADRNPLYAEYLSYIGRDFAAAKIFWVGSQEYTVQIGMTRFSKEDSLAERGIINKIQIAKVNLNDPFAKKAKQALFRLTKDLFDQAEKYFTENLLDFFEMGKEKSTFAYNEHIMDNFTIENVYFWGSRLSIEEIKDAVGGNMSDAEIEASIMSGKEFQDYFKKNWLLGRDWLKK